MAPSHQQYLHSRIWSAIFDKKSSSSQNNPHKSRRSPARTPSEHEFKISPTFPPHPDSATSHLLHASSCNPDTGSETSVGEKSCQSVSRDKIENQKNGPYQGQNMKIDSDPRRSNFPTPMAGGFGQDISTVPSFNGDSVKLETNLGSTSPFPLPPAGYFPVVFTLQKPVSAQMGLSLIAAEEDSVQGYFKIRRLLDAGACKRDGRIKEGDILAMVNGQHLINREQMQVINLLRRPIDQVSIVLLRQKTPKPLAQLNQDLDRQRNQPPVSATPFSKLPVTAPPAPLSPKLPRRNNRSNGTPKFPSDERRKPDVKSKEILPDVLRGVQDSEDDDVTPHPGSSSGKCLTKPGNPPSVPVTRNDARDGSRNGNNEHTFSDEDTEDEQEHNDVVASLINKYDPRNPFPATSPTTTTLGASITPGTRGGTNHPENAPSDDKLSNIQIPPTPQPKRPINFPLNPAPIELSDVENSDTNLSQFDINGKETPVDTDALPSIPQPFSSQAPPSVPNSYRPPQPQEVIPSAAPVTRSNPPVASSSIMTPEIDQLLAKTKPRAETKNTAIQTAPLTQPRRNVYPPGYFHAIEAPNGEHKWSSIASSPDVESEYDFAPKKYFVPQPKPFASPAVRSRSGLSTSSPIMEKLDNLSSQLDRLLNPDRKDPENSKRPERPFSAADLLIAEPDLSPISSLQVNTVPERCKSIDNLSVIKSETEESRFSSAFKTPSLMKSPNTKSTPELQHFNNTPPSPFKQNTDKDNRFKPLELPPMNYKDIKRPKSRRKTKPEDEDDDLATDRFLRDVHNLSAEFAVDPRTPLAESFRFPPNTTSSSVLDDAVSPGIQNPTEDSPEAVSGSLKEAPKQDKICNSQKPDEEPEMNISDLLQNSDLALDDLSRNSSMSHYSEENEDPEESDDNFDPEERQPEDTDEMFQNPATPFQDPPKAQAEYIPIAPPVNFATQMGETSEPEEAIGFCSIPPKKSIAASTQQLHPENELVNFREREKTRKFSGESNQSSLHSNQTFEVDYPVMDNPNLRHRGFHCPNTHQSRFKPRFDPDNVNFIPEDEVELQMLKESLKPPGRRHLFLNRDRPKDLKKTNNDKIEEFCRAKRKPVSTPFKDIDLILDSNDTSPTQKPTTSKVESKPPKLKIDLVEAEKDPSNPIGIPPFPSGLTDGRSIERDSTLNRNRTPPRFQPGRGSSLPPNNGAGSNTGRSTLDSVSFTIPLDDKDYENDISIASTPTILKNSFEDLNKLSNMKKPKEREKQLVTDPFEAKNSGQPEMDSKPAVIKHFPEKENSKSGAKTNSQPVGFTPTLSEPPSMVNLISYDDWKKSLSQELQPGDKIKRPVSVRQSKSPFPVTTKKKEDKKVKQLAQKDPPENKKIQQSPTKSEPVGKSGETVPKPRPTPVTNKALEPTAKTKGALNPAKTGQKPATDRKSPGRKSPGRVVPITSKIPQKTDTTNPQPNIAVNPIPKEENEPQRLSLSAQKSNDSSSPTKEKMGFNVALDHFKKPPSSHAGGSSPVRSSSSPRVQPVSPRVTPRNSFSRSRPTSRNSPMAKSTPITTRNVTPQSKSQKTGPVNSRGTKPASPSPGKAASIIPKDEKNGKNVIPTNFKFAQSDFAAKKNYFELSARLKAERTAAAKTKDNQIKSKKQGPKDNSTPKANSSSVNPVWI